MKHISTAVIIIDTFEGVDHCLFGLKQCDNPGWEFPGGKLEDNESVENCAVREVFEETGLIVNVKFLNCFVETKDYVCLLYVGKAIDTRAPEVREPDKHKKWEWFTLDNTPHPLMDYASKAIKTLEYTFPNPYFNRKTPLQWLRFAH